MLAHQKIKIIFKSWLSNHNSIASVHWAGNKWSRIHFQKANEISSLLCCVSMWNFRAAADWKIFPQEPQGGSLLPRLVISPPWLGWASFMCWFTYRREHSENINAKKDGSGLCSVEEDDIKYWLIHQRWFFKFHKIHLRHWVEDVLADKTQECCICVSAKSK